MARRRSPQQTLVTAALVILGLWATMAVYSWVKEDRMQDLPEELPDLEYVELSPEELYARPGFRRHENAPDSWDRISLRLYAEEAGTYVKFQRCTIDADEVERSNRDAFRDDMPRVRETDEGPPAWWPGQDTDDDAPWRVPDWWQPATSGIGTWWCVPDNDTYVGVYLHYDPDTRWMHLWEWRRLKDDVDVPDPVYDLAGTDAIASALSQLLVQRGHPAVFGDWLLAVDLDPESLTSRITGIPASLHRIDALLRPLERMRYLLVLHGVGAEEVEQLLAERPMRRLDSDTPPPLDDWSFARPDELPSWWRPGPGPRWRYRLARPGTGIVDEARWAAYDPTARALYVWDWRGR